MDDATADVTMFLILGALRGFNISMRALRGGQWRGHPPPPLGRDPEGKTLGILGMGGIGKNLRRKAEAFSMRVIYHNREKLSDELSGGAEYVSFAELLMTSDVISLNLPLNDKTRHKISTREFEMMKKGVVIVNTARGAIIDEEALVKALDSGHVASVGLDVYENEPSIHPGLLANDYVMLLPHMGTWTIEVSFLSVSPVAPLHSRLVLDSVGSHAVLRGRRAGPPQPQQWTVRSAGSAGEKRLRQCSPAEAQRDRLG